MPESTGLPAYLEELRAGLSKGFETSPIGSLRENVEATTDAAIDTISKLHEQSQQELESLRLTDALKQIKINELEAKVVELQRKNQEKQKSAEVVEVAKKIAGFSGHIGWQTYLKTIEDLKEAVDEYEDSVRLANNGILA